MKISPINSNSAQPNFNGKYVSIRHGGDLTQLPEWHKNSYAETTLGAYHADQKNRVYFADPMEPISDNIKENADKIIYDNEPSYPDVNKEVSRNYFGAERKNYKNDFEEVRQYYYRREMGGFASVEEAKYQQWQAAECARLYDKGGHYRYVKEAAEDEIKLLENDKAQMLKGLTTAEQELINIKNSSKSVEKHAQNLEKMEKPYKELILSTLSGAQNESVVYSEAKNAENRLTTKINNQNKYETFLGDVKKVYSDITNGNDKDYKLTLDTERAKKEQENLQAAKKKFEAVKAKCTKTIDMLNSKIDNLKSGIKANDVKIAEKKALIEDCKAKLIPLFDELKNFYANQGIKVIKKI